VHSCTFARVHVSVKPFVLCALTEGFQRPATGALGPGGP